VSGEKESWILSPCDEVTFDMFMKDYSWWREVSGSRQYTIEQVDRVFAEMFRTSCRVDINPQVAVRDKAIMESALQAAFIEHNIRQSYRMAIPEHTEAAHE
jgi:hypothetical protein